MEREEECERRRGDHMYKSHAKRLASVYRTGPARSMSPLSIIIANKRRSARKRKIEWMLTSEDAARIMCEECYYCGVMPSGGIDRTDSDVGYILSNSMSCCTRCNVMKNVQSSDDFLEHVRRIWAFRCFVESAPSSPVGACSSTEGKG